LPYIVTVNNIQIPINTVNDYLLVQTNINAYPNDNDIINIHFPIIVIFNDYSEKTVSTQTDFNTLYIECQANTNNFGKINCITINFPITINIYDISNQIASATSITSNQSLYTFFEKLEDNKFIAISYPISIINSNGENITVTTNSQFEDVIKRAIDTCPDSAIVPLDFMQVITSNPWKISYYFHESERTSTYNGYTFSFNSNYKVVATKSGITYNGTWSTKVDNGVREFELKFESDPLGKLDKGWKVFEFNNSQLRFRHIEDNNDNDYLYFEKN
jgi:hypothetical protein